METNTLHRGRPNFSRNLKTNLRISKRWKPQRNSRNSHIYLVQKILLLGEFSYYLKKDCSFLDFFDIIRVLN